MSKVADVEGTYNFLGFEFRSPNMIMLTFIRNYMGGLIHELLTDDKINTEGLNFLDRAFRHIQTHEAGQHLLINVLKDVRFVHASKDFSTELIAHVVGEDKAQEEFKKLIVDTLADERVQQGTVSVLKFITE